MMNVLNPGLQELTMGAKSPEELAKEYETWVAANDSNRQ
jgi:raffinose/stachyose/melibiose transport system substrate-binding protein